MTEGEQRYEDYLKACEKDYPSFKEGISNREQKAYEYGVLVVKNSTLVSGGGLLAIPAIVGLSSDVPINLEYSIAAAICFSCALVITIVATYFIHINWSLVAAAHEKQWEEHLDFLKLYHLRAARGEELKAFRYTNPYHWRIKFFFWVPHFMVIPYFVFIMYGFISLYKSFGII